MLAPEEKIKRGGNDIIQIIVCRICDKDCSNCTQLLPFRKDEKFMSVEVFREAVRSLAGWPGVIAMFGGNPCTHPQFRELCRVMQEEIPNQAQRGLWTNNLLKHGDVARETFFPFGRTNFNAHADPEAAKLFDQYFPGKIIESSRTQASWHSPILMHYKDYGISYQDWVPMRESCDVNQRWSAAIAERNGKAFAYFCEVAASLDGIRGENNGIEAVPEWWKFPMMWFHEQVRNCCDKGCGVPLRRKGHLDSAETYDYSQSFADLVQLTTAKKPNFKVELHVEFPEGTEIATDYTGSWSKK